MDEQALAPTDERRSFPRIPLLTEVWVIASADKRFHVKTRDLSRGGLCIEDDGNVLDVSDELAVEIRLPEDSGSVEAKGRVMWKSPGLAGLMFIELPTEEADRIDAACEKALAELKSFQEEKTPTKS